MYSTAQEGIANNFGTFMSTASARGETSPKTNQKREDRVKHLEIVQSVVSRMAGNSFLIKGWSITIAAAFLAMAAKDSDLRLALLALFPTLSFWGLDAYYLRLERLFRKLYDDIRTLSDEDMQQRIGPYSLRVDAYSERVDSWLRTAFSISVAGLHLVIVFSIAAVALALRFGHA